MASLISHAVAAVSLGTAFYEPLTSKRVLILGAACSVLPDIDVIGFRFGVHYVDFWGHRGFTHSIVFAVIVASLIVTARQIKPHSGRAKLWIFLFLATAGHGVLDAMTNGGLGVAFFSPFVTTRYFLPWRPMVVSPIGVTRFFSPRGFDVLQSELLWIWTPAVLFAALALLVRRVMRSRGSNR